MPEMQKLNESLNTYFRPQTFPVAVKLVSAASRHPSQNQDAEAGYGHHHATLSGHSPCTSPGLVGNKPWAKTTCSVPWVHLPSAFCRQKTNSWMAVSTYHLLGKEPRGTEPK